MHLAREPRLHPSAAIERARANQPLTQATDAMDMHPLLVATLLLAGADCGTVEPNGPTLPLSLNLPNNQGQAHISVPIAPPGMAWEEAPAPPADILRGEPGDLLRGPGNPTVRIEPVR